MAIVVVLIILGVLGWFLFQAWNTYQTRFAQRQALEEARALEFMNEAKAARTSVVKPTAAIRKDLAKTALLDAPGRLAYLMLKAALPEFEILARVDPAALFGEGSAQPPRAMLDLVVCKRDFTPVTVIMLLRPNEDPLRDRIVQQLAQNGLRVLRWPVSALPERNTVREQVLGATT